MVEFEHSVLYWDIFAKKCKIVKDDDNTKINVSSFIWYIELLEGILMVVSPINPKFIKMRGLIDHGKSYFTLFRQALTNQHSKEEIEKKWWQFWK